MSNVADGRYWVSQVWTEAEPVAEGVKPPANRDWYKRVKVRFDWVDSQGEPWWERPKGASPAPIILATEVARSPEAKRVAVTELINTTQEGARSEELQRTNTAISFYSSSSTDSASYGSSRRGLPTRKGKEKDINQLGPVAPTSGLLTPPITSASSDGSQLGTRPGELSLCEDIGGDSMVSSIGGGIQSTRRRLPGDLVLASFGEKTSLSSDTDISSVNHVSKRGGR